MPESPDVGQNSNWGISYFRISGKLRINQNSPNSRISNGIDVKRGPVIKLDKRNTATTKKLTDDTISKNIAVIAQLGAIRKMDSKRVVCKTYIYLHSIIVVVLLH